MLPVDQDKKPLVSWKKYQTQLPTEEKIKEWFSRPDVSGIAVITGKLSGLAVLDFEKGAPIPELPDTVTAKSGGDGRHYFFKFPKDYVLGNKTRIRELTDIRGEAGYIIVAPSKTKKGIYEWIKSFDDAELAEFPLTLYLEWENANNGDSPKEISAIKKEIKNEVANGVKNDQEEVEQNIHKGVAEGKRNSSAAQIAGELMHYLPEAKWFDVVWPYMQDWNQKNTPPMPEDELGQVFYSIGDKERGKLKNNQQTPAFATQPILADDLLKETEQEPPWLVQGLIPSGAITVLSAAPRSFKTWVELHLAESVASGLPVFSHFNTTQGNVLIIDEENKRGEIKRRLRMLGHEQGKEIYFWIKSEFRVDNKQHIEKLLEFVKEHNIKLVCFDSLVRVHGKEENDAKQMAEFFNSFSPLLRESITILLTHHHRKEQPGQSRSGSQSMRGSSDILAAVEAHLMIDRNFNEKSLTFSQNKIRGGEELKPFQLRINQQGDKLGFDYVGEFKEEVKRDVAKAKILELLVGGTTLSRQEIVKLLKDKLGANAVHDALKALLEEKLIFESKGAKGKKTYKLSSALADREQEV